MEQRVQSMQAEMKTMLTEELNTQDQEEVHTLSAQVQELKTRLEQDAEQLAEVSSYVMTPMTDQSIG